MNKIHKRISKGFTLLEILLVIAAIGILAAIVLVAINPNRQLAQVRNAQRRSDINTIYKALEQYLIDTGSYPEEITTVLQDICSTGNETTANQVTDCSDKVDLRILVPNYIASIPTDPDAGDYQVGINFRNNKISIFAPNREIDQLIAINLPPQAMGGVESIIQQGDRYYRTHVFNSVSSSTLSVISGGEIEYLIVAGGGGGGSGRGGGGGAGGVLTGSLNVPSGDYLVVVGDGGVPQTNGENSVFGGQIAMGGGAGGTHISSNNGNSGGSGGGGAINYTTVFPSGGSAMVGQGFNGAPGGITGDNPRNTGGGGGANEAGTQGVGTSVRPDGGDGLSSDITGTPVIYAGGGGGGYGGSDRSTAGPGSGGSGGGGNGATQFSTPMPGQDGLGGGGGGGGTSPNGIGAPGGSGVVIIRYEISQDEYNSEL